MKKAINVRIPVAAAGALVTGIIYSALLAFFKLSGIFILIPVAISLAACALLAVIGRRASKALTFLFIVLFFVVGAVYAYAKYFAFTQSEVPVGELTQITGRVEEVGLTSGGRRYLIITDAAAYGTPVNGKIYAYLSETAGDYCRRGYTVSFYSELQKENFIEYGAVSYRATQNVKYFCNVYGGMQSKYAFSLFGEIEGAIEDALYNSLDGETAAVCFAMLTGNTDGISQGTLASFRYGGVAHVFAVSGLHIGVIYAALSLIFKKCRVNRFASAAVKIAFVVLYSGVCNFSPSSVRATVICSVSALAGCLYRKYDFLNAIAVAAVILLLINPFYLFQTGFTLSFSAVLGIALLSANFKRILSFLPKRIADTLAVGWSAQFATVPSLLSSFGYVSVAGLFLNVIFVPLVSVVFVPLLASALFCAVFPYAAPAIMPIATLPLQLTINIITTCGFENAIISGSVSNLIHLPFIAATVGLTDRINFAKFRLKSFCRGAVVSLSSLALVLGTAFGSGAAETFVTFTAGYSGGAAYIGTKQGSLLIVTQDYVPRGDYDTDGITALVVVGKEDNVSVAFSLGGEFDLVCMRGGALGLPSVGSSSVICADEFVLFGVEFKYDTQDAVLNIAADGVSIAVVMQSAGETYGSALQNADFNLYCYDGDCVLVGVDNNYDLSVCGQMRYELSRGKVLPSFVVPKE